MPIIKCKECILICQNFLEFTKKPEYEFWIKKEKRTTKEDIIRLAEESAKIFKFKKMLKLELKSTLTAISLFWRLNQKFQKDIDPL